MVNDYERPVKGAASRRNGEESIGGKTLPTRAVQPDYAVNFF